ncbi:MAG: cbb3-type cytochrome c oxidase subunit I, partial [Chloroflexota bacterium]
YYWFPKMTGKKMNETLGKINFWTMFLGFNGTFITLAIVGMQGMPRRVPFYFPPLQITNDIATYFAYLLGASFFPFLVNLVWTWVWGEKAEENPYQSRSLEWLLPTPVPPENFEETPLIVAGPYQYGLPEARPMAVLKPSESTAGAKPAGS